MIYLASILISEAYAPHAWDGYLIVGHYLKMGVRMTKNADLADLRLEADSFRYKGATYPFSEIAHLRFARMNLTTYMVPVKLGTEGSAALIIDLISGEQLKFVEKPGWFLTSEQQKIDGIVALYVHLSQATFQTRLAKYLSAADQRGYFVYSGYKFFPSRKVIAL